MSLTRFVVPLLLAGCLCSAQQTHLPATTVAPPLHTVATTVVATPLQASVVCSGAFVTHRLDFTTGTRLREIGTYISNGAGVAANDLDNDGDLDLVFASVDGEGEILWNEGNLQFTSAPLDDRFARGVAIVDANADGWNDIVFTHRGLEGVTYWRNLGGAPRPTFARTPLPGVDHYAYAMAWGDVDGDGDLDLVTGSYGAELKQHGIDAPEDDPQAGVVLHLQGDDAWTAQTLDPHAETLSIAILDVTNDSQPEIWAANDFALDDRLWQRDGDVWHQIHPFAQTSYSTMTTEWGDIANDGRRALFTTDMNPYDISPRNLAAWMPVLNQLVPHNRADDVQVMANVLLIGDGRGGWQNQATARGVDATGWSWDARFGDLDQDGYLDLYIVNGMIAADLFGHLPNGELVEENQAYRNRGNGSFDRMPQWQLGATASGRGMIMADIDNDGDLDIVINNLRGFAQLYENQLCSGANLQVDLTWSGSQNIHAIGAQLALHTDKGILRRDVRASGGYLSGDPVRVHFGIPAEARLDRLEIEWPDGKVSLVDAPPRNNLLTVTR
ncbi:MAG TPA: CRTAC1 family protein [Chloroflexi bacterium]|nr:CRTAC1 family protein [Chloroflexota bacterium]HHW89101.1 CRTAC1 family protein [Chloroflexota bacterium]